MVFDHTPLTTPLPEAHLWSPYCEYKINKNLQEMEHITLKIEFY